MESWQEKMLKVVADLEEKLDNQRFKLKEKLDMVNPVTIQAYRGFGNENSVFMRGRVLENEGLDLPPENASVWQNIRSLYHRFESDEIPDAKLEVTFENYKELTSCNKEGFFSVACSRPGLCNKEKGKWQKVRLHLKEPADKNREEVITEGEIQIPQDSCSYGIISDIDDTIVVTKATEFLEKMQIFLLRNSHTRKPLAGVAALYRAMEAGKERNCQNPFFYVSGSSWNLYDVLEQFCKINEIPKGTFLLRELGISGQKFIKSGHEHYKPEKIFHVMETYPGLPFVLIGDSGQRDPEVYQKVVERFPDRIKAIYIRDVKPEKDEKRDQEVKEIARQMEEKGVKMLLIQTSTEAARHACEAGLIHEETLQEIEKETKEDKQRPNDISQLLGLDHFL